MTYQYPERIYGSKYQENMDIKDIAKEVRKAIKMDGFKFSVKIQRFSGGQSLKVRIKEVPDDFPMVAMKESWNGYGAQWQYSPELKELMDYIEAIINSYNYDGSDSMVDYFDVNFYGFVDVESGSPAYDKLDAERELLFEAA
jgi:hypothetical protein